jgi:hypothetical protein
MSNRLLTFFLLFAAAAMVQSGTYSRMVSYSSPGGGRIHFRAGRRAAVYV